MSRFKEGLYDQLVTRSVRDFLKQGAEQNLKSSIDELEETDSPEYLARHLARQIKGALRGLPAEERKLLRLSWQMRFWNSFVNAPTPSIQIPWITPARFFVQSTPDPRFPSVPPRR